MNINKLADDLEKANEFQYVAQLGLASLGATMLRILDGQLAFRIDAVNSYQKIVEELQEKLNFTEQRLKLSDNAFDAIERKVRGLQEDLTETRLCYYKVVEQRNDAYAEIKALKTKTLTDEEFISVYTTWALTGNDPLVLKKELLKKASDK